MGFQQFREKIVLGGDKSSRFYLLMMSGQSGKDTL
jgi:hypothetical protein